MWAKPKIGMAQWRHHYKEMGRGHRNDAPLAKSLLFIGPFNILLTDLFCIFLLSCRHWTCLFHFFPIFYCSPLNQFQTSSSQKYFSCRAVFSVVFFNSASLTRPWSPRISSPLTCSHRSCWLKIIFNDVCGGESYPRVLNEAVLSQFLPTDFN